MTSGRLGLIAGGSDLPRKLAEHARAIGRDVFVLGLKGFADPGLVAEFCGSEAAMGEIGKGIRLLKKAGCDEVVFAGTVRRPDLSSLQFDMQGAALIPDLVAAAGKGDDALLRVVLGAFERAGFRVVGADDVLAALLAPQGPLASRSPTPRDWIDIRVAAAAAARVGAEDIGQGAIARDGKVLVTEDQAGTDAMLGRVTPALERSGVLVKRPKAQQERRIDLPTIGVETLRGVTAAGLSGLGVEAGAALIIDCQQVAELADKLGIFVYGFTPAEAV